MNECRLYHSWHAKAACQDRPTKQTFARSGGSDDNVNLREEFTYLNVGIRKSPASGFGIQLVLSTPYERYQTCVFHDAANFREPATDFIIFSFRHEAHHARSAPQVDMQLFDRTRTSGPVKGSSVNGGEWQQ